MATSIPPLARASIITDEAGSSMRGWTKRMRLGSNRCARRVEISSALRAAAKMVATFPPLRT